MKNMMIIAFASSVAVLPNLASAEEFTATVGNHSITYTAPPERPVVQISPEDAVAAVKRSEPARPRMHIDPTAQNSPETLK